MRYFTIVNNGNIVGIGTGIGGVEISGTEYNTILNAIRNKPTAESGYDYRLKTDLTWELYELPVVEEAEDEEATVEDYEAALAELGVK